MRPPAPPGNGWDLSGCPACGETGLEVADRTVAALTRDPLPRRQLFRVCRAPTCRVAYFGEEGAVFPVDGLTIHPGFKTGGDLLCYCFGIGRSDLAREAGRKTPPEQGLAAQVRRRVAEGDCACAVRNPTGRCCLGDLAG